MGARVPGRPDLEGAQALTRLRLVALGASVAIAIAALAVAARSDDAPPGRGDPSPGAPNLVVVVTDDQSIGSLRGRPEAMPWLADRLDEPGWTTFTNTVVSTPMCCPSRATILTGRYARRTGVTSNAEAGALDASDTLAVWLHDAGYRTGLVGKYLNGYPWADEALVPPGWDRWFAKLNVTQETTYVGYDVVDDGVRSTVGDGPEDYATDRIAAEAASFVRDAPADRPFFLYVAPSAPHYPWTPAARHEGLLDGADVPVPTAGRLAAMNDVAGLPGWARSLPPVHAAHARRLAVDRVRERVALRAVDDAVRAIWREVAARGETDRTVLVLLSDNGFSYGERRWVGKACPWEACLRVPFVAHVPGTPGGVADELVANVDVAPTLAALAGVDAPPVDGLSLLPLLRGEGRRLGRDAVFIDWSGRGPAEAWEGVRLADAVFVRHADGTVELYDLAADPRERRNLAADPSASALRTRAERLLDGFVADLGAGR
ncbi:MAG TPA: sulfatase [Actinomycetota bacterium]